MKRVFTLTAKLCVFALCTFGFSSPSYAQSSDYETARFEQSVQARIGVSIPFGGDYKKAHSKPQFALGLRHEAARPYSHDWAMRSVFEQRDVREFKLALTMEAKPSFLMNDQVLNFGDESLAPEGTLNALDPYDKTVLTVIGVSLAVIAGSIIILAD